MSRREPDEFQEAIERVAAALRAAGGLHNPDDAAALARAALLAMPEPWQPVSTPPPPRTLVLVYTPPKGLDEEVFRLAYATADGFRPACPGATMWSRIYRPS